MTVVYSRTYWTRFESLLVVEFLIDLIIYLSTSARTRIMAESVLLRSLKYSKQRIFQVSRYARCCELLFNWDLWNIRNNNATVEHAKVVVVNCCLIEIFEIFETTLQSWEEGTLCCELLFNWDLWNIRNNIKSDNDITNQLWIAV